MTDVIEFFNSYIKEDAVFERKMVEFRYLEHDGENENILRVVVCCRFLPISDRIDFVKAINGIANKENLDLSSLTEQTVKRYFMDFIEKHQLQLHIENDVTYFGDKELLSSIIINLIENAIKYSTELADIKVLLKSVNSKIILEIQDLGCGIAEKEKEIVFQKFFRSGDENTRKTKGTGIGLYIVKSICDIHQIKINILNNTPKGSIFQLHL